MKNTSEYYLYIITNRKNGVLYIRMTGNIKRRMYQHKSKSSRGFSGKYRLKKLVYYEKHAHPKIAIKREKQLKKWNRSWKINLINDFNPDWEDLTERFQ